MGEVITEVPFQGSNHVSNALLKPMIVPSDDHELQQELLRACDRLDMAIGVLMGNGDLDGVVALEKAIAEFVRTKATAAMNDSVRKKIDNYEPRK
jgi:hypothetical protein